LDLKLRACEVDAGAGELGVAVVDEGTAQDGGNRQNGAKLVFHVLLFAVLVRHFTTVFYSMIILNSAVGIGKLGLKS